MCDALGRFPDELNGHLMMFRGFYHFNLRGDDELVTKGAYLHIQGLKGRGVQDLQESMQSVLKDVCQKQPDCEKLPAEFEVKWIDDDSAFAVFSEPMGSCKRFVQKRLVARKASLSCPESDGLRPCKDSDEDHQPNKRRRLV